MLMESIFTWVMTTSGTHICIRELYNGHTGDLDICPHRTDTNTELNRAAHLAVTLCRLTRGLPHSLRATVLA